MTSTAPWHPTPEQVAKVHALLRPRVAYLPPARKTPARTSKPAAA